MSCQSFSLSSPAGNIEIVKRIESQTTSKDYCPSQVLLYLYRVIIYSDKPWILFEEDLSHSSFSKFCASWKEGMSVR